MNNFLKEFLPSNYKSYKIEKIENGASYRKYYRLSNNIHSVIFMHSSKQKDEFNNFLNIHKILSSIDISIPKILEADNNLSIAILEDFGNLRFDKIINDYPLKDLLESAVESLIILKNEIKFNPSFKMPVYNYNILKKEISEFIDFYYPYFKKEKIPLELEEEFYVCWKEYYDSINFNFFNFVHKDYNLNNLIYLPQRNKYKKCGIIDFQNAFWGEDCWDLFSLLEDSRLLFNDEYNEYFVKFFFNNTFQQDSFEEFQFKYHFLNCSRQSRLLGRWIKLANDFNQKYYLEFINVTNIRLKQSLKLPFMQKLNSLYKKIIPELYGI